MKRYTKYGILLLAILLSACSGGYTDVKIQSPLPASVDSGIPSPLSPIAETTDAGTEMPETTDTETIPADTEEAEETEDTFIMTFVGDVMLAAENGYDGFWSFNQFAYDTPPSYYFEKMQSLFATDDYTVVNLENVFSDSDSPVPTEKTGEFTYWYYSRTKNAEILSAGSIEIASVANNHILDYGKQGKEDTVKAVTDVGVTCVTDGNSVILEKNGIRVALLCTSLWSEYYVTPILEWLDSVSQTTDYQIVYYHGGTERVYEPDAWRVRASHAMADAGADLILGNHPHVLQPIETYNGVKIVYSLGDFLFGGAHTCVNRTVAIRLTLYSVHADISSVQFDAIPCYCYGELWQPTVIEKEADKQKVTDFLNGERDLPY